MSKKIGTIGWLDLTVQNADEISDFYNKVVGWQVLPFAMNDYNDYMMKDPATGDVVSGICHARGSNADLPAQWMVYIYVADLDSSLEKCTQLGGKLLSPVRNYGDDGKYCIIQDPAGAVMALFESLEKSE